MTEPKSDIQTKYKATNPAVSQSAPNILLRFRRPLIVLAHLAVFAVSLMLSFLVASNMQIKAEWLVGQYPILLAFVLVIKTVIFGLFKQYRGWWRPL